MPNITIEKDEIIFLRDAIIQKYCNDIKEPPDLFLKNLTGTLRHYESISDVIQEYLEEEEKIFSYAGFIAESPFKIILRKWMNEREEERKRHLRDLRSTLSGNVLRKLVFYGEQAGSQSFKDFFILACYIYTGIDRSTVLSNKQHKPKSNAGTTLSPAAFRKKVGQSAGDTVPPYPAASRCVLKPLDENDKVAGEAISFEYNGSPVSLNRNNLDPENNTITSKTQAALTYNEGKWIIENFSQYKTTYLQIIRPTSIQKGDILVFGNKRFLFDEP